jgi:NAD(P)-dependent dehydrogenase (short-subunit alcohol dehydrogenase family)
MNESIVQRSVIITGGNRGIGEAIMKAFWERGDRVLVGARTPTESVRRLGEWVRFQKTDVRSESDHRALVKTALDWTGRLDVYINCAGFSKWLPIGEINERLWAEMVDTNLKGTFWGCKAAAEALSSGGCIINISSIAGKRGSANNSLYCATKFGVNGLTQSLAKELGPKGIRVNAVCPVYVTTDGLIEALNQADSPSAGREIGPFLKEFAEGNAALRRLPEAREIARVCVFLASPDASAVTGQCLNVDCGVFPQ